jgi:ribonuclease HII
MKIIHGRKWEIPDEGLEKVEEIKKWLLEHGGKEIEVKQTYEKWRIKYYDATITYYESQKKRTIYITPSDYDEVLKLHEFIDTLLGSQFVIPDKDYLIGLDEVGKGEVIGHVFLVGVLFPKSIYPDLEKILGVANTKVRRESSYWEDVFRKIDYFKSKGLCFICETIPPWDFDKYNINALMDITYQRILNNFAQKVSLVETKIVIDDYGIGPRLKYFLDSLKNTGAEIIVENGADEKYLESRIASLIAKYYQIRSVEGIKNDSKFKIEGVEIGSGNAGDIRTLQWLKKWWELNKFWPWFVKTSFKTIAEIEGKEKIKKKSLPSLNDDLLSFEFIEKFYSGKLNIDSLAVNCSKCGSIMRSLKLAFINETVTAKCINCKTDIEGINSVLRYYCGRVVPDANVILRGFLSKDLGKGKFFENFTILISNVVKSETDTPGGKKEWERLSKFASIGRIKLEEVFYSTENIPQDNLKRDEIIIETALKNNAILITADNSMKAFAQAKKLFVIEI